MKKFFVLSALILAAFSLSAQCLSVDEYDPYTKTKKRESEGHAINVPYNNVFFNFALYDSTYLLHLVFNYPNVEAMVTGPSQTLNIILDNDYLIVLHPNAVYSGDFRPDLLTNSKTTRLEVWYEISRGQLTDFVDHAIKSFRLYLTDNYIQKKVKYEGARKVKQAAVCIWGLH